LKRCSLTSNSKHLISTVIDFSRLMQRFHRPTDENRMLVILRPEQYDEWLHCRVEDAPNFFKRYPAERLVAQAAPKPSRLTAQATFPTV
jgi:putative SOS response-associated peptidase YedK